MVIHPDWTAPPNVRAVMTTRNTRAAELEALLPGDPIWLRQVHGTAVANLDTPDPAAEADAAVTRTRNRVCAIRVAECMPVLLADV